MVLMLIVMMTMTMIRMALMEKKMMLTESYAVAAAVPLAE